MSLRDKFQFSYPGQVLAEACERRRDRHAGRCEFWEAELATAKAAFKDAGVEFREYPVTGGGTRLDAVIDPPKQQRLNECQGKVAEHRGKIEEYDRWARGFRANADSPFALDPDDIAYFGL
jgi:hypothetical protein